MSRITFNILHRDSQSRARVGRLETPNGVVETPAFVPVATQAAVKTLSARDLNELGISIVICNTYHLHLRPGEDLVRRMGGLHRFMNWRGVIMTDSGGFQVFSLGASLEHGVGKVASIFPDDEEGGEGRVAVRARRGNPMVRLTEEGAHFRSHLDGSPRLLTPENVIEIQNALGSDIMLVLDECTSPLHDFDYTRRALQRTHRWAARALTHYQKIGANAALYGIIQGGAWEELRCESARFIGRMPFDGFAIGGSLGRSKQDMYRILEWVEPLLPPDRPRHLLGIGDIDDVFETVARGVDTFDCVLPTRSARHKTALVRGEPGCRLKLDNAPARDDPRPLDPDCTCPVCNRGYSRAYLHHLFKAGESVAGHLVTLHNIHFMTSLMQDVRAAIRSGRLSALHAEWSAHASIQ